MLRNAVNKALCLNARHCAMKGTPRFMSDTSAPDYANVPEFLNQIVLQGRLSSDVRVRTDARGNQLVQGRMMTENVSDIGMGRSFTEWHNIYIFSGTPDAQEVAAICKRGDFVRVEGSISTLVRDQGNPYTLIKAKYFKLLMKATRNPEEEAETQGSHEEQY